MGFLNIFSGGNSRPGEGLPGDYKFNMSRNRSLRVIPLNQAIDIFRIKHLNHRTTDTQISILSTSKNANVRCVDCGWKYNFQRVSLCPICFGERTYLLSDGIVLNSLVILVGAVMGICALAVSLSI